MALVFISAPVDCVSARNEESPKTSSSFVGMLVAPFIVLNILLLAASAAFTHHACWQRNCLARNDVGALCFVASANGQASRACYDEVLVDLLRGHLDSKVGLSIAYYDDHAVLLGASTWPVPSPLPSPIFVCMSGPRTDADGGYRTLCRLAVHDDDVPSVRAHARECSMDVAQPLVTDGCYSPPRPVNNVTGSPAMRKSPLDSPSVQHPFFVLSGIATIVALCAAAIKYRKAWVKFAGKRAGLWVLRLVLAIPCAFALLRNVAAPASSPNAHELVAIPATDHVSTAHMTDGDSAAADEGDAFRTAEAVVEECDITNE